MTIRTINSIKVSVNATSGVITSTNPVTVRNISTVGSENVRLDQLSDVVPTGEIDKATLVYDAASDKYIVKLMEFNDISGDLDGGTF